MSGLEGRWNRAGGRPAPATSLGSHGDAPFGAATRPDAPNPRPFQAPRNAITTPALESARRQHEPDMANHGRVPRRNSLKFRENLSSGRIWWAV
jgi:hypothetical protein